MAVPSKSKSNDNKIYNKINIIMEYKITKKSNNSNYNIITNQPSNHPQDFNDFRKKSLPPSMNLSRSYNTLFKSGKSNPAIQFNNKIEKYNNTIINNRSKLKNGLTLNRNSHTADYNYMNYNPPIIKTKTPTTKPKTDINLNNGVGTREKERIDKLDIDDRDKLNLFMSYKNSSSNTPINLAYSTHEAKAEYSNNMPQVLNKNPKNNQLKVNKNSNIPVQSAKCVKEYSYKEEKNSEYRESMEDYSNIIDKFMNDNTKGLFCLYDGHGGLEPVKFVAYRLPELLSKFLIETKHNVEKSFINSFTKVDEELKSIANIQNIGSTACVLYFHRDNDIIYGTKRILSCANVGDTRAILITENEVKRLSYDHKCTDENEVSRIRKMGGIVFNGRMFGQLALSRAFGDHAMKKYGLLSTPFVNKHIISERDKFAVVGSDGVWDVLKDEDVFELSMKTTNANDFANLIVRTAFEKGSRDNISCIAVKLN